MTRNNVALQKSCIGGGNVTNASGETVETRHPGHDLVICEVEKAGIARANEVVEAGKIRGCVVLSFN